MSFGPCDACGAPSAHQSVILTACHKHEDSLPRLRAVYYAWLHSGGESHLWRGSATKAEAVERLSEALAGNPQLPDSHEPWSRWA